MTIRSSIWVDLIASIDHQGEYIPGHDFGVIRISNMIEIDFELGHWRCILTGWHGLTD